MQDETPEDRDDHRQPRARALHRRQAAARTPRGRRCKAIADGATIDEITARIRDEGESCSRSAVGRYTKDARELIQKRQEADRVVKAWMQEFGDRPQGELTLVLIENLRAMAIDTMRHLAKREEPASSEDIARLSLALKRIESTEELRIQREQAAEKAAEAAKPKPPEAPLAGDRGLDPLEGGGDSVLSPRSAIPSYPDESQLSPDKLAEMYPEIAPRLYRTSPQSILSLGPEPESGSRPSHADPAAGEPSDRAPLNARSDPRMMRPACAYTCSSWPGLSRPSTSFWCLSEKERGCPQQVRA